MLITHFEFIFVSRELNGRTRTATWTPDIKLRWCRQGRSPIYDKDSLVCSNGKTELNITKGLVPLVHM